MSLTVIFPGTGFQGPPGPAGPTGPAGPNGIVRSISSLSASEVAGSAANTDYVYFCTGTFTLTLPSAVGNTNRYSIINSASGVITVATTSGQTIDGSATYPLAARYQSADFLSNSANWGLFAVSQPSSPGNNGQYNFSTAANSGIFAGAL
jgi:hypothetical protein